MHNSTDRSLPHLFPDKTHITTINLVARPVYRLRCNHLPIMAMERRLLRLEVMVDEEDLFQDHLPHRLHQRAQIQHYGHCSKL